MSIVWTSHKLVSWVHNFIFGDADERSWDSSIGDNLVPLDVKIADTSPWVELIISSSEVSLQAPVRGPTVDWNLVRSWLHEPSSGEIYKGMRHVPSVSLPPKFRMIDVERRRVIVAPPGCEAAAPSYVWGVNQDQHKLLATNASITELKHDGAVSNSSCMQYAPTYRKNTFGWIGFASYKMTYEISNAAQRG